MARFLVALGIGIALVGLIMHFFPNFKIGRLPGDFHFKLGETGNFYFPLTTSIIASVVLSFILYVMRKLF
ncbi:MAG: DUF2905 domain-containing protein [Pseudobacteriovorax sp.]|nr:DUF2905 domain-containing protein [Pseudobacteriovorax sp.]